MIHAEILEIDHQDVREHRSPALAHTIDIVAERIVVTVASDQEIIDMNVEEVVIVQGTEEAGIKIVVAVKILDEEAEIDAEVNN